MTAKIKTVLKVLSLIFNQLIPGVNKSLLTKITVNYGLGLIILINSIRKLNTKLMKPFQSGTFIASWLLRIMLVWFLYSQYFQTFTNFSFKSFDFYVSAAFVAFGVLLLAAGFIQKPALTVFSGLVIFIIPIVQLIRSFPANLGDELLVYLIPLSVGFYFFTSGNNR
jgi:hypothetical protein